ncbi:MAG: hypothetical protein R3A44_33250 [Caldilineaceae bacterium]
MTITLKLIKDAQGCLYFQELERLTWASPDDDLIPTHVGVTVLKNGGALLGAFADDGPAQTGGLVGAALWWIGTDTRPIVMDAPRPLSEGLLPPAHIAAALKVCSHIAGVLPQWQGRGIGLMLKLKQRELVLQQGLTDRITWTYDPLYRTNGVLNIHRLERHLQQLFYQRLRRHDRRAKPRRPQRPLPGGLAAQWRRGAVRYGASIRC